MMYSSAFGKAISYMPLNRKKDYFKASTTVLLVAKQYIYVAAKNEDPFCFSGYLAFLKNKLEIDKTQIRDLVSI